MKGLLEYSPGLASSASFASFASSASLSPLR